MFQSKLYQCYTGCARISLPLIILCSFIFFVRSVLQKFKEFQILSLVSRGFHTTKFARIQCKNWPCRDFLRVYAVLSSLLRKTRVLYFNSESIILHFPSKSLHLQLFQIPRTHNINCQVFNQMTPESQTATMAPITNSKNNITKLKLFIL